MLKRAALILAALAITLFGATFAAASPVVLTFDVEKPGDDAKLKTLNIQVPATYYFLGKFAEDNQDFVKSLAQEGHTIGSHAYSHANLTEMPKDAVRLELKATKELLERITGQPSLWFRAPFMAYNDTVMELLRELGYRYDSSENERWCQQTTLLELPVSSREGDTDTALSDYDIFDKSKLDGDAALEWLKQRYLERKDAGRPMVLLLHPSIIAEHKDVLHRFIDFARQNGAEFITSDQWVERLAGVPFRRVGLWIDFTVGEADASQLIADAKAIAATDIFLMARDHEGREYFSRASSPGGKDAFGDLLTALKTAGFRVHAWLPVLFDPKTAQLNPEWAMVEGVNRAPSVYWLSPFHKEVRYALLETVTLLVSKYRVDGLHLDYIRYPDLKHDFSANAVDAFVKEHPGMKVTPDALLSDHYTDWVDFRARTISGLVRDIRQAMEDAGHGDMELSAALIADAATSYRSQETYGQDYAQLARYLDTVVPMAYFKGERKAVEWISNVVFSSRYKTGSRQLLTGLAAYQKPDSWLMTDREFEDSLKAAVSGANGIVFYNYGNLFGRGKDPGWNMKPANTDFLGRHLPEILSGAHTGDNKRSLPLLARFQTEILLAGIASILAAFLAVWVALRRKNIHGRDIPVSDEDRVDVSIVHIDFPGLEERIRSADHIEPALVKKVSSILKSIGPHAISRFRRMRLLQMVKDAPLPLTELQQAVSNSPNMLSGLRRIEEAGMLGYLEIDGRGHVKITDLGRKLLEKAVAEGYSQRLINFIDQRLVEHLIITCAKCQERTLGHWFWETYECSGCHHKSSILDASAIELHK